MPTGTRTLKLSLNTVDGAINRFYAFLDGKRVIAVDGNKGGSYSGDVGQRTHLQVRVWGIDDATYELSIDLPGTADDQDLKLSLSEGYHELDLQL